jgi:hypothetical protein
MKIQRSFAHFHMPFMDNFYAEQLKCAVMRDNRYKQHITLTYGDKKLLAVEKYKTVDSQNLNIEILKDLVLPIEQAAGLFFDKHINRLVHVICSSSDGMFSASQPNKIYIINLDKMRSGLSGLLQSGGKSSIYLGTKFKKSALSLNIEWSILQSNNMVNIYNL